MKRNTLRAGQRGCLVALLMAASILSGCGSNSGPDPVATAQDQERARLTTENQALAQARTDHEEVLRLKKENQDLPKIRSQYQEATRLRKENEQLREQIARIAPAGTLPQGATATPAGAGVGAGGTNAIPGQEEVTTEVASDAGALNEGDEILVEPKNLKQLLPDFDWDKLERTAPVAVRALLERDGYQLTNVSQLKEYGLTNFVIQRALTTNQPPAQETH